MEFDFAGGLLVGVSREPLALIFEDTGGRRAVVELPPVVAQVVAIELLRDPRVGADFDSRVREWLMAEYQREAARDKQELANMGVKTE